MSIQAQVSYFSLRLSSPLHEVPPSWLSLYLIFKVGSQTKSTRTEWLVTLTLKLDRLLLENIRSK
jgi:hypothetical protein